MKNSKKLLTLLCIIVCMLCMENVKGQNNPRWGVISVSYVPVTSKFNTMAVNFFDDKPAPNAHQVIGGASPASHLVGINYDNSEILYKHLVFDILGDIGYYWGKNARMYNINFLGVGYNLNTFKRGDRGFIVRPFAEMSYINSLFKLASLDVSKNDPILIDGKKMKYDVFAAIRNSECYFKPSLSLLYQFNRRTQLRFQCSYLVPLFGNSKVHIQEDGLFHSKLSNVSYTRAEIYGDGNRVYSSSVSINKLMFSLQFAFNIKEKSKSK